LGRAPNPAEYELLNRFNHEFLYGSASFAEDGDVHLSYGHDLEGGVTRQNIRSSVRIWRAIVPRFLEIFTGSLPQVSVDRPGPADSVTNPSLQSVAGGEAALRNALGKALVVKSSPALQTNR
jgi:hypothetical protein